LRAVFLPVRRTLRATFLPPLRTFFAAFLAFFAAFFATFAATTTLAASAAGVAGGFAAGFGAGRFAAAAGFGAAAGFWLALRGASCTAKAPPCGSIIMAIQLPPGTSIGPCRSRPPPALAAATARLDSATST